MQFVIFGLLIFFNHLFAQPFFGRWYLLDFSRCRAGELMGTNFTKDSASHFITDPQLTGNFKYFSHFKYDYFLYQNHYIIALNLPNQQYNVIILKYINFNKAEIHFMETSFSSISEIKQYLSKISLHETPFIPVYSDAYIRTFSSMKPFHTITQEEFAEAVYIAMKEMDNFQAKFTKYKSVRADKLINILLSIQLLKRGYSPFAFIFPESLLEGEKMQSVSEQFEAYTHKW